MTEFLADSGRLRIDFIGRSTHSDTRGQLRRAGYEDALAELARGPRIVTPDGPAWTTRAPGPSV